MAWGMDHARLGREHGELALAASALLERPESGPVVHICLTQVSLNPGINSSENRNSHNMFSNRQKIGFPGMKRGLFLKEKKRKKRTTPAHVCAGAEC